MTALAVSQAPKDGTISRRRRRVRFGFLFAALLLVLDWSREPPKQLSAALEIGAIRRYQVWISPWLQRGGVRCRFTPSCSRYAVGALAEDGFVAGNLRTAWRLLRCGPWTRAGTVDPP